MQKSYTEVHAGQNKISNIINYKIRQRTGFTSNTYKEVHKILQNKKKYILPATMWLIFETIAITLWLIKDNLFYLFNFSYIGTAITLGILLFLLLLGLQIHAVPWTFYMGFGDLSRGRMLAQ